MPRAKDEPQPTRGQTALLIIDMINDMSWSEASRMMERTLAAADSIARLRDAARRAGVAVIYVNDNFGQWHSERSRLIDYCAEANGRPLVDRLRPADDDYFVIKPRHSGFYATNLPVLLPYIGATRLILTGIAADICVLFTAGDAHMRDYRIWCPSDCVAAADEQRTRWALDIMKSAMNAETRPTSDFSLADWLAAADEQETWAPGKAKAS